jgi:NitT/TauT family transport system ATP-binding protein
MAPRPGRVVKELTLDEPYPRGLTFRTSGKYGDIARETSEALMTAMGEEEAHA